MAIILIAAQGKQSWNLSGIPRGMSWQDRLGEAPTLIRRSFERDVFDTVGIGEFHDGMAPTCGRLPDHLQPQELVGSTAAPNVAPTDVARNSSTAEPPAR